MESSRNKQLIILKWTLSQSTLYSCLISWLVIVILLCCLLRYQDVCIGEPWRTEGSVVLGSWQLLGCERSLCGLGNTDLGKTAPHHRPQQLSAFLMGCSRKHGYSFFSEAYLLTKLASRFLKKRGEGGGEWGKKKRKGSIEWQESGVDIGERFGPLGI